MGNAEEQLEAALVDSIIKAKCEISNGTEVTRSYETDAYGNLVINSTIVCSLPKSLDYIKVDLNIL